MEIVSVRKRIARLETRIVEFERKVAVQYEEIIRLLEKFEGGRSVIRKIQKD